MATAPPSACWTNSAVKCVQCFDMCGYCDICTGYLATGYQNVDTAAENQLCPTGAIVRTLIEEKAGQRFYEYTISTPLCIGCGLCVKGCALMNGSLYLQVMHDRCVDCNECAIAASCPTLAFDRIPRADALSRQATGGGDCCGRKPTIPPTCLPRSSCDRCINHEVHSAIVVVGRMLAAAGRACRGRVDSHPEFFQSRDSDHGSAAYRPLDLAVGGCGDPGVDAGPGVVFCAGQSFAPRPAGS